MRLLLTRVVRTVPGTVAFIHPSGAGSSVVSALPSTVTSDARIALHPVVTGVSWEKSSKVKLNKIPVIMTFFICCSLIKQVRKDIKIILSHCGRQGINAVKDSSSTLKTMKLQAN
jgi:hypothetical protein